MKISRIAVPFVVLLIICITSTTSYGQKVIRTIYYPTVTNSAITDYLEIEVDKNITSSDVKKIVLLDTITGVSYEVVMPANITDNVIGVDNAFARFNLQGPGQTLPEVFLKTPKFLASHPILATVVFAPDKDGLVSVSSLRIDARLEITKKADLESVAPKGRDDAQIYISGESITSVGDGPIFSADIKYDRPIKTLDKKSNTVIGPYLSYIGTTKAKADPDQLRAGIKAAGTIWDYKPKDKDKTCFYCYTRWEASEEFESNRHFTVKNLLTTGRLNFGFRPLVLTSKGNLEDNIILRFVPFIGTEVGRNLRSPTPRDEKGIGRVLFGMGVNLRFPAFKISRLAVKEGILLENSFTQRSFFKPEVVYDKDDNGNIILKSFGKQPHPYGISKLTFLFGDFVNPSIKYEWGDLPPLYERIQHKVTVGFTFSLNRQAP